MGRRDIPCPTTTPQISSFGTLPCSTKLNAIKTHGKYGAVKTRRPKKLSLVSGFLRDQMYTSELLSADPRKGIESIGLRQSRIDVAYRRSHEKCAGDRPDDSSSKREYRWRKKTWKRRSRDKGPK